MKIKRFIHIATLLLPLLLMQEGLLFAKPETTTNKKQAKILPVLVIIPIVLVGVWRISHRSGVKSKDIRRSLPGDSIIADANWVINRSSILNAPIDQVWPWIEQLGRNRAGWYAPNWMENTLGLHALRTIDTAYQNVKNGDILDDWGPGYQRVLDIKPPYLLLVDGVKKVKVKNTGKDTLADMGLTILTMLEKVDSTHTKLIFRLRTKVSLAYYLPARGLGGLFDYTTFEIMASGLNERLKKNKHETLRNALPVCKVKNRVAANM